VLGPQVSELQLTHVETMKSPTSDFHVVRFSLQPASASAFATYTAGHIGEQLAFVRDGVVLFAPKITQAINSQTLEISGDLTAQQADDVARMLRQPA
jgi:preprotein translocase subunit SecD